jgi:predicted metal-dependent phosphoesterase TrpH
VSGPARIDLHAHTAASDGTDAPDQLLAAAAEAGLDVVAITDHDTTAGWAEAAAAVPSYAVALVRGMEISCAAGGISVHLLSYLHDPDHGGLAAEVEEARASRSQRAQHMVELLAEDFDISWADILAHARPGASLGRPHMADALVRKGIVANRDEAFADILSSRGHYYVGHYAIEARRAVRLVREAGGVPVMAHPMAHRRGRVVSDQVIAELAAAGLGGIEVFHPDHDDTNVRHARAVAEDLGLLVTGSSDYHGTGKVTRLGARLTDPAVLQAIEDEATGVPVLRP